MINIIIRYLNVLKKFTNIEIEINCINLEEKKIAASLGIAGTFRILFLFSVLLYLRKARKIYIFHGFDYSRVCIYLQKSMLLHLRNILIAIPTDCSDSMNLIRAYVTFVPIKKS